ncbi:MAG: ComF family protein [Nitrospirales bacterium]
MRHNSIAANTKKLVRKISHALLPSSCTSCNTTLWGDPIPFFCRPCWSTIQPLSSPQCPRCSLPFHSEIALRYSPEHCCGSCRTKPPAFSQAWTLYPYQSPLKEAIKLFKYQRKVALTGPITTLLTQALGTIPPIDLIIPVPLHATRLREREYNQSLLLASGLSQHLHIPLTYTTLVRIRETPPQTSLTKHERLKNLRRSFAVKTPQAIAGKTMLLVDDVYTTGTTVNECAKVLRKAGAGKVYVVTLARMIKG